MQVNDTVYCLYHQKGKKKEIWCRAKILEISGGVARLSIWTGKDYASANKMLRDLKTKDPNESST